MAITSGMYLKVPITPRYTNSKLDIEANNLYKLRTSSEIFYYSKVETSIQMCIQLINRIKFDNYEESMLVLCESLKLVRGLKYL